MTMLQAISVWTLRALALFGALELGADAYANFSDQASALARIEAHGQAMARLNQRIETAERRAATGEAALAGASRQASFDLAGGAAITDQVSQHVRDQLIALGAEAPTLDVTQQNITPTIVQLHIAARWREPTQSAPHVLYSLSTQYPHLGVKQVSLTRRDGGYVDIQAELDGLARRERRQGS